MTTAARSAPREARVQFNRIFKPANTFRGRYRVLKGSAGSGKSVNIAQDYILKLSDPFFRGANLLVVRKVEASHKYSTFAELTGAIFRIFGDDWPTYWEIRQTPLSLRSTVTGAEIVFRGVKDDKEREKIKSINFARGKLTWIWIEEATELLENDIEILDDRLRGILPPNLFYQMTFTFNPVSSQHWIKRRFWDYDDDEVFKHHSTYLNNRFIDDAYHKRMERRKRIDPEGYKVYGLGEWGEVGGLILTNYEIKDFPTAPENFDAVHYGQDFGFNHYNAILEVGLKDGDIYIRSELYVNELDTGEIIDLANARGFDKRAFMYCDSAEPDRIKMWKKAGYRAKPVKKGQGSVRAQIDLLKGRKIFIHPSCVNTIKEIQQWKWKFDDKTGLYEDEPVDFFDDAMAALRYATEPLRRPSGFGAANVRI